MKKLVLSLLLLLPACSIKPNVYEQSKNSIMHVTLVKQGTGPVSMGTGFLVDEKKGYVVTAFHVFMFNLDFNMKLSTSTRIDIELPEERGIVQAEIVKLDPSKDLALLHFIDYDSHSMRALKLDTKIYPGEEIHLIGFPLRYGLVYNRGNIAGINKEMLIWGFGMVKGLTLYDIVANPGDSGACVLDNDGEVVGILQYASKEEGLAAGQSAKAIENFLRD